jgi:hypothetical protein
MNIHKLDEIISNLDMSLHRLTAVGGPEFMNAQRLMTIEYIREAKMGLEEERLINELKRNR